MAVDPDAPPPETEGPHVVLVGMMGVGKTTVGRLVAERLSRPFLDSDQVIEQRTGRTVREIWREDGEPGFRALEQSVLVDALGSSTPSVIAAAGGTVLSAENRELLRRNGCTVWLRADLDRLVDRARSGAHRPLLDDDPTGTLRRMRDERAPLYGEVATSVVDVDDDPPARVAHRVLEALR